MTKIDIFKRLYKDYTSKFLKNIILAALLSVLVAGSTSATAWLLDPAIEKIFINKDQTLIILIPFAIILAFSTKGISLYFAKLIMINVGEEVKKIIQTDMLRSFIKADTETIESKHSGNYVSNLNFDVQQITRMLSEAFLSMFKDGLIQSPNFVPPWAVDLNFLICHFSFSVFFSGNRASLQFTSCSLITVSKLSLLYCKASIITFKCDTLVTLLSINILLCSLETF